MPHGWTGVTAAPFVPVWWHRELHATPVAGAGGRNRAGAGGVGAMGSPRKTAAPLRTKPRVHVPWRVFATGPGGAAAAGMAVSKPATPARRTQRTGDQENPDIENPPAN